MFTHEQVKEFLKTQDIYKHNKLSERIGWAGSSFSQWMQDKRTMPQDRFEKLLDLLIGSGLTIDKIKKED